MHLSEGVVVGELGSCSCSINDDSLHKRRHRNRFSCYRASRNHAMPLLLLMVAVLTMLPYQSQSVPIHKRSLAEVTTTSNPIIEDSTTEEIVETTTVIMLTSPMLAKTETNNTETETATSGSFSIESEQNRTISTKYDEEDEENEIFTTLDDGILKEIKMSPVFVKPKSKTSLEFITPKPEVEQTSKKDQLIDETTVEKEDETIVITTSTTEIDARENADPTKPSLETSTVAIQSITDGNPLRDSRNLNFEIKQGLNTNEETNTVEAIEIETPQSIQDKFNKKLSEFISAGGIDAAISDETGNYENSIDNFNDQQLVESTKLVEHSKPEVVSSGNEVTTVLAEETSAINHPSTTYIPELPEAVTTSDNDELSIVLDETLSATEPPITWSDDKEQDFETLEKYISETSVPETTIAPERPVHTVIKKQGVDLSYEDTYSETTTVALEDESPVNSAVVLQDVYTTTPSNDPSLDINANAFDLDESTGVVVADYPSNTDLPEEDATSEFVAATTAEPVTLQQPTELEDVPEVFSGEEMATASIKGSRSINMLNSAHFDDTAATLFAGQTFNDNLAAESSGGIVGKALPTISVNDDSPNRSFIIIVLCSGTAILFIAISVVIFLVSFQRQHGTLDIEMQEQRCGKDDLNEEDAETCMKLLEVELPQAPATGTDETDECL